tara:strand:- start:199 stop:318 length:120 start_codon:yes stop_codon:yes gene_type:complete
LIETARLPDVFLSIGILNVINHKFLIDKAVTLLADAHYE